MGLTGGGTSPGAIWLHGLSRNRFRQLGEFLGIDRTQLYRSFFSTDGDVYLRGVRTGRSTAGTFTYLRTSGESTASSSGTATASVSSGTDSAYQRDQSPVSAGAGEYASSFITTDSMLRTVRFSTLQSGLVLFWAIWLSIVTLTNIFDALKQLGLLPDDFTMAAYNFDLLVATIGAHGVSAWIGAILFAGALTWEFLGSALLWRAWNAMRRGAPGTAIEVTQAFAVNLALWAAFLIATELTVNYATAGTHKTILIAQLATLLVLRSPRLSNE
jgi:hypothetical protein